MILLILTLAIALAGLAAIEFGQPRRPRADAVWSDDLERRLLRAHTGSLDRW